MTVSQVSRIDALTRDVIRKIVRVGPHESFSSTMRDTPFGNVMPKELKERDFAKRYFENSIRWALLRHNSALKSKDRRDFIAAKEATILAIKIGEYVERQFHIYKNRTTQPKSEFSVLKETLMMRFLLYKIAEEISQLTMPEATRA